VCVVLRIGRGERGGPGGSALNEISAVQQIYNLSQPAPTNLDFEDTRPNFIP
jgi:hypothetical protein